MIKKIAMYLVFGLFTFGVAAGVSWVLLAPADDTQDEEPVDVAGLNESDASTTPAPTEQQPVAVHGRPMSAEDIFRFGAVIRKREETLKKREADLLKNEMRLKLIHDDIQTSRREFDGSLADASEAVKAGEAMLSQLQEQRRQLEADKTEFEQRLKESGQTAEGIKEHESASLKVTADWFTGMAPESAAERIVEWINQGELDTAVEVLRQVEPRNAARILEVMDKDVVGQVLQALKNSHPPLLREARGR